MRAVVLVLLACAALACAKKERWQNNQVADIHKNDKSAAEFEEVVRMAEALQYEMRNKEFAKNTGEYAAWLKAGTVGRYFDMKHTPNVPLPITLNLVFIGFQGNGNLELDLTEGDLRPWFEHIEHHLEHTVIRQENSRWESYRRPVDTQEEPPAKVLYEYHFNVIELAPAVQDVMEAVIHTYMRPVDPNEPRSQAKLFQVDVDRFSVVMQSLLHDLYLSDYYTLVIMNPKRHLPKDATYGYRSGFSDQEIKLLRGHPAIKVGECDRNADPHEHYDAGAELPRMRPPREAGETIDFHFLGEESEAWANNFLEQHRLALERAPQAHPNSPTCATPPFVLLEHDNVEGAAHRIPIPREATAIELADDMAASGTVYQKEYLQKVQSTNDVTENCLTDNWVGHGRWAFVDLSAGPFAWGPKVGGEGVRSPETIPRVTDDIMLSLGDTDREFANMHAGVLPENLDNVADVDVLDVYYEKFCRAFENANPQPQFCLDLVKKRDALLRGDTAAANDVDLGSNVVLITGGESESADIRLRPLDEFNARLGAVVDSTLHSLVSPPSTSRPTFYRERTSFHLYVVTNHNAYEPVGTDGFDWDLFKREMKRLQLPAQEFSFSMAKLSMKTDEWLAMAYTTSLKTARTLTLTVDGTYQSNEVMFIDSAVLQSQLQILGEEYHEYGEHESHSRSSARHVPIFLFSLDFDRPVFVDKSLTAKALDDMIIVVQSNFKKHEGGFACNHKPVFNNLRTPTASALAAAARYVGGVVHTHMLFSLAEGGRTQDWLWSVGDNPFCLTASQMNHYLSKFHIESAHRHYVVSTLEATADLVNDGVRVLEEAGTTSYNYDALQKGIFTNMTQAYEKVRAGWRLLYDMTDRLDYPSASLVLKDLLSAARDFHRMAVAAVDYVDLYRCEEPAPDPNSWLIGVSLAADAVFVLMYFAFRSRSTHVKVN